jgi:hypothetical protein
VARSFAHKASALSRLAVPTRTRYQDEAFPRDVRSTSGWVRPQEGCVFLLHYEEPAEAILLSPALQRLHTVFRQDRLPVVPSEAVAQYFMPSGDTVVRSTICGLIRKFSSVPKRVSYTR